MDRRARAIGVSRNRLIIRALAQAVSEPAAWPPELFDTLRTVDEETFKRWTIC